jgi:hypothetical protein
MYRIENETDSLDHQINNDIALVCIISHRLYIGYPVALARAISDKHLPRTDCSCADYANTVGHIEAVTCNVSYGE